MKLTVAFVSGATAATFAYAFLRIERVLWAGPDANPALVIWSPHAGFFWRSLTAGYFGGAVAFAAWLLLPAHEARIARALPTAVSVAAAAISLQALFVP